MRDPWMHSCVARTIARLILDFMKFVVSEEDFPDFWARPPARFCRATTASFPSTGRNTGFVVPWPKRGDENRFLDGTFVAGEDDGAAVPEEETYLCVRQNNESIGTEK